MNSFFKYDSFMNILTWCRESVGRNPCNFIHATLKIIFNECALKKDRAHSYNGRFPSTWFILRRRYKIIPPIFIFYLWNVIFQRAKTKLQYMYNNMNMFEPTNFKPSHSVCMNTTRILANYLTDFVAPLKEIGYHYKWRNNWETKHLSDELFRAPWQMMAHNVL